MRRRALGVFLIIITLITFAGTCFATGYDGGYNGNPNVGGIYVAYDYGASDELAAQLRVESVWNSGRFSRKGLSFNSLDGLNAAMFVFFDEESFGDGKLKYIAPQKNSAKEYLGKMAEAYGFSAEEYQKNYDAIGMPMVLGVYFRLYEAESGKVVYPVGNVTAAFRPIVYYGESYASGGGHCSPTSLSTAADNVSNAILVAGLKDGVEYTFEYWFCLADMNGNNCHSLGKVVNSSGDFRFTRSVFMSRDATSNGAYVSAYRIGLDSLGKVSEVNAKASGLNISNVEADSSHQLVGVPFEDVDPLNYIEKNRKSAISRAAGNDKDGEIASWFQLMRTISLVICVFGIMVAVVRCALPGYQGPFLLRFKAALAGWVVVVISIGAVGTVLTFFFKLAFGL